MQMSEIVDRDSPLHVENEKKARLLLDRDDYMRKVNQQNASAFNQYVIYQNEMRRKKQRLMKRSAAIDTLANSVDGSANCSPLADTGSFSHLAAQLQSSAVMTAIYSKSSNPPQYNMNEKDNRYRTSHVDDFCAKERVFSKRSGKKYNKRKSPYQQFSDAKYNMGVFFNPAINGL